MQHEVIGGGQPYGVGLNETFLSQLLKQVNYSTHLVGKVMFISQLRVDSRRANAEATSLRDGLIENPI